MGSVDVFITPDEKKESGQDLWQDPETGLYVGLYVSLDIIALPTHCVRLDANGLARLSVMHDLHCIVSALQIVKIRYLTFNN